MVNAEQSPSAKHSEYATAQDFCRIFHADMSSLYLLSLLLAGDHERAEQCFVGGLESAVKRNTVFREWARSWARRMILQNALHLIHPRPNAGADGLQSGVSSNHKTPSESVEIAAVLALRPFDRFVFVMSVLEGYSDQDCAILLGCARADVLTARVRALREVGNAAEFFRAQRATREIPARAARRAPLLESEMYYAKFA